MWMLVVLQRTRCDFILWASLLVPTSTAEDMTSLFHEYLIFNVWINCTQREAP
jgi:hypothetical protein